MPLSFSPAKSEFASVVIGRPRKIAAVWSHEQVEKIDHEGDVLRLHFVDGSQGGLHVPPAQRPGRFLEAWAATGAGKS